MNEPLKNQKLFRKLIIFAVMFFLSAVFVIFSATRAHAAIIEPLYKVLAEQDQIKQIWNQVLTFVNSLGAAVLIFVAFSNILRININNYGIKKFLPTLVLTIIAANFSYLICRLLIDLANVACDLLISGPGKTGGPLDTASSWGAFDFTAPEFNDIDISNYWTYMVLAIGEFAGGIMLLILAFLFFVRNYVIYFLVVLSPLAFVALAIPQAKSVFNQWWSNFWKWAFLPIVSLFWLWIASRWAGSSFTPGAATVLGFVFAGVCYYLAITTPFKMGGSIMQQWGNLGKKAWGLTGGAAGEYGKRKAGVWWSGQAAGKDILDKDGNVIGNRVGLLGRAARIRTNINEAKKYDEEIIANNQQKALSGLMRSKVGRQRLRGRQSFGGDLELAEAQTLAKIQESEEGKKWLAGRQQFLAGLENSKSRVNRNFQAGEAEFRDTDVGKNLSADRERLNRQTLLADQKIQELQKNTTLQFLGKTGKFDNPADKKLLYDMTLAMTRNLNLDESLKSKQQQEIDRIFQGQASLGNMKEQIEGLETLATTKIDDLVKQRLTQDIDVLEEKKRNGTIFTWEERRLDNLREDLGEVDSGRETSRTVALKSSIQANLRSQQDDIATAAKAFYTSDIYKGEHLEGMVKMDETDPTKVIDGFDGLAEKQGLDRSLGTIMMTRVGKLVSLEVKADVEKRKDEKTPTEIGNDLDARTTTVGYLFNTADGKKGVETLADGTRVAHPDVQEEVLKNFREGKRYLNDPQSNREIEARNLAIAQIAKQQNNMDSPAASAALLKMMSNETTLAAKYAYNASMLRLDQPQSVITETDPEAIKAHLEKQLGKRGGNRQIAYSSIMNQPNMGSSKNPGQYLSTADSTFAGNHQQPQSSVADANVDRLATALISRIDRLGPDASYSKLSQALGQDSSSLAAGADSMSTFLSTQRTRFAQELAKSMGITLTPILRKSFVEGLGRLPKNATPEMVAEEVRKVVPDANPNIDPGQIAAIVGKSQNMNRTQEAIQMLSQKQNIEDHQPYLDHYANMNRGQVEEQAALLAEARQQVEHNPVTDEALNITAKTLQQTGFAPAQGDLASGPKQIDQLFMAEQAAKAALGAYDQSGKYNPNQAVDNLANYFVEKEGRINRQSEDAAPAQTPPEAPAQPAQQPSPGLGQDVRPPQEPPKEDQTPPSAPPPPAPEAPEK